MSVLKQCDAQDHLSVVRDKSRNLHGQIARPDHADPLEIKPGKPRTNRSIFLEDFIVEHSLHGLQITSIEIAGSF
jgi:hypothetical protein